MKDLLDTLKRDIGIVDDENSRQPRSRSGSRRNSLETGGDKKYLTLQRLGTSALDKSASGARRRNSKASLNNSRFSSESKGIMNDYENQIAENIQSIRRNSKESLEEENRTNANTSLKKSSSVSSGEGNPMSDQLNVSRKSLTENQPPRKNSTDSESTASIKKTGSILKRTNYSPEPTGANKENLNPDSDSDDDIYMGEFSILNFKYRIGKEREFSF